MKFNIPSRLSLIKIFVVCCILTTSLTAVSIHLEFQGRSENQSYKNIKTDFTLTSHLGSEVSLSDYRGKAVILFFGYTRCPEVCPMELTQMQEVMKELGDKADMVQVLFITVDPERDTPEIVKKYLTRFHPSFMGFVGTTEEISKVAKQYNIHYLRQEVEFEAGYMIGHSSTIYLINKQGELHNIYRLNPKISFWKQMKADLLKLI